MVKVNGKFPVAGVAAMAELTPGPKFKPFKSCVGCFLQSGFDDIPPVVINIVPTMQNIVHDGKRYFRLSNSRRIEPDGSQLGAYLWEGWANEKCRRDGRPELMI